MKTKFLLTLLAMTGVFISANSAVATTKFTPERDRSITNLSQTIANLINLEERDLVELAIDRALLAQQVNEPKIPTPIVTAGLPRADIKPTEQKPTDKQPTVRGRINKIKTVPIGRIQQPQQPSIGQTQEPTVERSIGQTKKSDNQSIGQSKRR
ncbi:hypothetical protein [Chamaesiphon sp. VAR_48_metabat_403]|uniref:hypothetical protein n=1 Tax=Chamaesiphon sp. VAR_48_metabat_403 TaxID=2964700 RepID=UPI00286DF861|nr:hypothetical protein [Chamaesiphon sp. VAR_48_metabat_403]